MYGESLPQPRVEQDAQLIPSVHGGPGATCVHSRRILKRSLGRSTFPVTVRYDDGAIQQAGGEGFGAGQGRSGQAGARLLDAISVGPVLMLDAAKLRC